jgi:hypothetical protein
MTLMHGGSRMLHRTSQNSGTADIPPKQDLEPVARKDEKSAKDDKGEEDLEAAGTQSPPLCVCRQAAFLYSSVRPSLCLRPSIPLPPLIHLNAHCTPGVFIATPPRYKGTALPAAYTPAHQWEKKFGPRATQRFENTQNQD